jgi:hypothetical protein
MGLARLSLTLGLRRARRSAPLLVGMRCRNVADAGKEALDHGAESPVLQCDDGGPGGAMAKLTTPAQTAETLSVPERLLLLCVATGIDFKHAKVAERFATEAIAKRLITLDTGGQLALTDRGRAVVRAMLPDL